MADKSQQVRDFRRSRPDEVGPMKEVTGGGIAPHLQSHVTLVAASSSPDI
jgi:hypothetical protein